MHPVKAVVAVALLVSVQSGAFAENGTAGRDHGVVRAAFGADEPCATSKCGEEYSRHGKPRETTRVAQSSQAALCQRVTEYCSAICDDHGNVDFSYFAGTWRITQHANPLLVGTRTRFDCNTDAGGRFVARYPGETVSGKWGLVETDDGDLALYIQTDGLRGGMMSEGEKTHVVESCSPNQVTFSAMVTNLFSGRSYRSEYAMMRE
jgi:hypothetical protein